MTLKEWVVTWLKTYKRIMIKPSTYKSYSDTLVYINSDVELSQISNFDIQALISDMVIQGLSYSTIKHMLTLVRQALHKARSLGLIDNLAMLEELELPRTTKNHSMPLSASEVERLILNREMSFYGDFFLCLLLSGMRVGELIALRWSDVNMFSGVIHIRNTDYKGNLQAVKTDSGKRTIPLYGDLLRIFKRLYRNKVHDRVFVNTLGRPIVYRTLLDAWKRYCFKISVDPCGLHKLRHTFAHRALRAGVPIKVVSAWLGHADVSITLEIYDAVDGEDFLNAAKILQKNNAPSSVVAGV